MRALACLLLAASAAACGTENPGPREQDKPQKVWCGDRPCIWSVDAGEVRAVPTWSDLDPDLELSGPMVRLSRVDTVPPGVQLCAVVDVSLSRRGESKVRLEVDLGDDGTVELTEPLEDDQNVLYAEWYPEYPDALDHRPVPGTPGPATSARLALVKEGPNDVRMLPQIVRLRQCRPLASNVPR